MTRACWQPADHLVEMGPEAGADGRARSSRRARLAEVEANHRNAPHRPVTSSGADDRCACARARRSGRACSTTDAFTWRPSAAAHGEAARAWTSHAVGLTAVTGVSGSGKTTLVLEEPHPRARGELRAARGLPAHVARVGRRGHRAGEPHRRHADRRRTCAPPWPPTPGVHDELRRALRAGPRSQGRPG